MEHWSLWVESRYQGRPNQMSIDMQGQRYQRNKQVLDQMMNSLSFNR
ncbi:hypothetical protein [Coleofasciculus sp. F4-SAH-05]